MGCIGLDRVARFINRVQAPFRSGVALATESSACVQEGEFG